MELSPQARRELLAKLKHAHQESRAHVMALTAGLVVTAANTLDDQLLTCFAAVAGILVIADAYSRYGRAMTWLQRLEGKTPGTNFHIVNVLVAIILLIAGLNVVHVLNRPVLPPFPSESHQWPSGR